MKMLLHFFNINHHFVLLCSYIQLLNLIIKSMVWSIMFNCKKEYKSCRILLVTSPKANDTKIGKTGV